MTMDEKDPLEDALEAQDAVDQIASMRIRGAAKIGRTAAACLGRAAQEAATHGLHAHLEQVGRRLVAARPTAVTLRNAVNLTLDGLREREPDELAQRTQERARAFVRESHAATKQVAQRALDHLPPGSVVLTHCHSSLVVECLIAAHEAHGDLRVYADETRPWWQGHISTRLLAEAGVPVTIQVDSAARYVMETKGVDRVLVGADAVMADGSLYNKIGTHPVALGAHAQGVPFMVACETHKFSPYSLDGEVPVVEERDSSEVLAQAIPGVQVLNPVFDRTPPHLIQRYITQERDMEPASIKDHLVSLYGDREGWL